MDERTGRPSPARAAAGSSGAAGAAATAAPHRRLLAPGSLAALAADSGGGQAPRAAAKATAAGGLSGGSASARAIVSTAGPVTKQQHEAPAATPATATAAAAPAQPRALQLVRLNPRTGQMEVGAEALAALRACKGPVGVVAVAGRARSGKSYVLNAILRRAAAAASGGCGGGDSSAPSNNNNAADEACCAPGGFALAHSYRPCTKGLWLWSAPVGPIDSLTGEQAAAAEAAVGVGRQQRPRRQPGSATDPHHHHHLVLLDTEGIDAYDQTTTDGVRIFALAVLLSSLFVFNQFGAIDEAALDRLSLVTELTRHIRVRAKGGGGGGGGGEGKERRAGRKEKHNSDDEDDEDEDEERRRNMRALGAVNPRLLWLLRDFYFDLDDDLDEEEEAEEEEDEYEEEQRRGRGSSSSSAGAAAAGALRRSGAAPGPKTGDVRASATFEPGRCWPPAPAREEDLREGDGHRRAAAHRRNRPRTTPGDYLEAALAPAPQRGGGGGGHASSSSSASAAALAAKNAVRQSIKALFPDRDCFTLVRPVTDERALRKLDALPASALRPEFRRGVARLARLVLERAGPKTVHGHVVTGPVLAGLAEAYVAAINAGAVPTIATAWEGVAERECRRAAREAEDAYVAAFGAAAASSSSAAPPLLNEPELLDAEHRRALAIARRVFAEEAVGGGGGVSGGEGGEGDDEDDAAAASASSSLSARESARRQLEAALDRRFALVRARALADADAHAERMLAEGRQQVSAAARLGRGGWRDVSAAVADIERRYGAEAGGTAKWPRLLSFVREAYDSAGHEVAERLKSAAEARIERAELAAREAKTEAGEQRLRADAAEAAARSAAEAERERREREREQYSAYGGGGGGGGGSGNGLLAWLGCFGGGGGGGRY